MFTACSDDKKVVPNFDLGATSLTLSPKANSGTFTLNANVDWNAKTEATWLTISPADGKAGEEITITVTAEANTTSQSRTAKVSIYHGDYSVDFTVTQTAAKLSLYPDVFKENFKAEGESKTLIILADSRWDITGLPEDKWCDVDKATGEGGTLADTVIITTTYNTSFEARDVTLTVSTESGSKTIAVVQEPDVPRVSIESNNDKYLDSIAKTYTYNIVSNTSWTIEKEAGKDWCTLDKTSGTGNASLQVTLTKNTNDDIRSAELTFKAVGVEEDYKFTVNQIGLKGLLILNPENLTFSWFNSQKTVEIFALLDWEIGNLPTGETDEEKWISVANLKGTGTAERVVSVKDNKGAERRATLKVTTDGLERDLVVIQKKYETPVISVTSATNDTIRVGVAGGDIPVQVVSNTKWTVGMEGYSITLTDKSETEDGSFIENGSFKMKWYRNPAPFERVTILKFAGYDMTDTVKITVIQAPAALPNITIDSTGFNAFSANESTQTFTLESTVRWQYKEILAEGETKTWFSVSPSTATVSDATGNANTSVSITVEDNRELVERTADIRFESMVAGQQDTIFGILKIKQAAYDPTSANIRSTPKRLAIISEQGATKTVKIDAQNVAWNITHKPDWCSVSKTSGSAGEDSFTVTFSSNMNGSAYGAPRYDTIKIKGDDGYTSLNIPLGQIGDGYDILPDIMAENSLFGELLAASSTFDQNQDGKILIYSGDDSRDEVLKLKGAEFSFSNKSLTSIYGIEAYKNITAIDFSSNTIKEADLSYNTKLKEINLNGNTINYLDISNCMDIVIFKCTGAHTFTKLDLSNRKHLRELDLTGTATGRNGVRTLKLNGCDSLAYSSSTTSKAFKLNYTDIDTLDLSSCKLMSNGTYNIQHTNIEHFVLPSTLTIKGGSTSAGIAFNLTNGKLKKLNLTCALDSRKWGTITLTGNTELTEVDLSGLTSPNQTPGSSIMISNTPALTSLTVHPEAKLVSASTGVTGATNWSNLPSHVETLTLTLPKAATSVTLPTIKSGLKSLTAKGGSLTSINVTGFSNLTTFDCSSNALTSITGLSDLTNLTSFNCDTNQLTSLSGLAITTTSSVTVKCNKNKLGSGANKTLDLSGFVGTGSLTLECTLNELEGIDFKNKKMTSVNCSHNNITHLDVSTIAAASGNVSVTCTNNSMTNFTGHAKVNKLFIQNNLLTTLNVSMTSIPNTTTNINCTENPLTTIYAPAGIETDKWTNIPATASIVSGPPTP